MAKRHNRDAFDCGDAALNDFLRRYARQAHEQGGAKTFVAVPDDHTTHVLGFYTLSPASVQFSPTPPVITRGLARHDAPAFRLGRLAVERTLQGQGLGGQLLLAAGRRCLRASQEVGGVALLIDAKDESVASWYASFGALRLLDAPLSLLLPLATIKTALETARKL
jgi:GNAT superfamily N-acetyltransferase